jgi:hypothetical protein
VSFRSLLRREPLGVALVLLNIIFGIALARHVFFPPTARTARAGLPPGHPDVRVPSDLPVRDLPVPGADLSFSLSGTVELAAKLKGSWPPGAHVFVIARPWEGGPPYAVRRYDAARPPFTFSLDEENVMIRTTNAVPERFVVSARADQDGDALTRQLGDLESPLSSPVPRGGKVILRIDRRATLVP